MVHIGPASVKKGHFDHIEILDCSVLPPPGSTVTGNAASYVMAVIFNQTVVLVNFTPNMNRYHTDIEVYTTTCTIIIHLLLKRISKLINTLKSHLEIEKNASKHTFAAI